MAAICVIRVRLVLLPGKS